MRTSSCGCRSSAATAARATCSRRRSRSLRSSASWPSTSLSELVDLGEGPREWVVGDRHEDEPAVLREVHVLRGDALVVFGVVAALVAVGADDAGAVVEGLQQGRAERA